MPPHSSEIAAMRSSRRNRRLGEKSPNSGCRPECSMRLPSERARQEPSSRTTVPSPEGKRHFLVRGSTSAQKISAGESRNSEELDGSSHGGNSRVRWSGRGVRPQARTAWFHRGEVTPASIAPMSRWLLVSWRIRLQSFSRRAGGDRDLGPRRQLPSIQDCNRAGQNLMLSAHVAVARCAPNLRAFAAFTLGYAASVPPLRSRERPEIVWARCSPQAQTPLLSSAGFRQQGYGSGPRISG